MQSVLVANIGDLWFCIYLSFRLNLKKLSILFYWTKLLSTKVLSSKKVLTIFFCFIRKFRLIQNHRSPIFATNTDFCRIAENQNSFLFWNSFIKFSSTAEFLSNLNWFFLSTTALSSTKKISKSFSVITENDYAWNHAIIDILWVKL